MSIVRIIPCLDVKEGRVVKGVNFFNLKDAGDPVEAAESYMRQGADELVFLDIFATLENRKTRLEWVKKVTEKVSIPFTVGGGVRNLYDMEDLFNLGVNKVSINSAAVSNPELIGEATKAFGTDKLVVAIDGQKKPPHSGKHRLEVVVNSGNQTTGMDVVSWSKKAESMGAAEILLTSKDADGTKNGYDLEMTLAVAEAVTIPVIASGGAGALEHFYQACVYGKASAVLAASVLHFNEITIPDIKLYLAERGIAIYG